MEASSLVDSHGRMVASFEMGMKKILLMTVQAINSSILILLFHILRMLLKSADCKVVHSQTGEEFPVLELLLLCAALVKSDQVFLFPKVY